MTDGRMNYPRTIFLLSTLALATTAFGCGGSDGGGSRAAATPAAGGTATLPATATSPASTAATSTAAAQASAASTATSVPAAAPTQPAVQAVVIPEPTAVPSSNESGGALSSVPAPGAGGVVAGTISLSAGSSCSVTN